MKSNETPHSGSSESHWKSTNPAEQPPRAEVMGLPRMVLEARTKLGGGATPEQVAEELRHAGTAVPLDDIRKVWDEGHQDDQGTGA